MFGLLFLITVGGIVAYLLLTAMRLSGYHLRFGPFRLGSIIPRRETVSAPRRVAQSCKNFHAWEVGDPIRPELRTSNAGIRAYAREGGYEHRKKLWNQHISECLETEQCRKGRFTYRGLTADGEILLMQEGRKIEHSNKHGDFTLFRQREGERPFSPDNYTFKNLNL